MSDKVVLSRTNPSMVANEEGARNDFSSQAFVLGFKPPFRRIWLRNSKNHEQYYTRALLRNFKVAFGGWCDPYMLHFINGLPLRVGKRWTDRSGERLDFYLRGIEPQESQS